MQRAKSVASQVRASIEQIQVRSAGLGDRMAPHNQPARDMKIDLLSPQSFASGHPFGQYRWLRENAPVYRHEEPGGAGFWVVTRYRDVHDVDRNHTAFSSEPTIMIQDPAPEQQAMFGPYK